MIHSMAGGVVSDAKFFDFAKVKTETGEISWYISKISDLNVGDEVVVPVGKTEKEVKATVLRIDKHINGQVAPFPLKKIKYIISKL